MKPGSFRVLARTTVHFRRPSEPLATGLEVALLTRPPDADGAHAEELVAPGYRRQVIEFREPPQGQTGGRQLSRNRVSFGEIGRETGAATHAAIYDIENRVVAYSFVERVAGAIGPDEIAFEAGMIEVRF